MSKYHNIGDIRYILKEFPDEIPDELIQDFLFKLYDVMDLEESK